MYLSYLHLQIEATYLPIRRLHVQVVSFCRLHIYCLYLQDVRENDPNICDGLSCNQNGV